MNSNGLAAFAFDFGAHRAKRAGQIDDLGFARAVLKNTLALSKHRRHHHVFSRADARKIKTHASPGQAPALGSGRDDVPALELDLRAELFQPFEMEIDRTRADGATAGKTDFGFSVARQQRSKHDD